MYYLIHTSHSPRPYVSTISFIANDFASWGHRVTRHAANSAYITEVRYQEKRHRPASRRIELMEIWAKEVLARKQQPSSSLPETRNSRASAFAQDFVSCLSAFGTSFLPDLPKNPPILTQHLIESPFVAPKPLQNDPHPLPPFPLALVARYTRLLHRFAYTSCATLPSWADPSIHTADQIALDFRFERGVKREQLTGALREAIGKGRGRMGRVEWDEKRGVVSLFMWVDIGDLMVGKEEEGEGEPVPVYERGGWVWPPAYEGVVAH